MPDSDLSPKSVKSHFPLPLKRSPLKETHNASSGEYAPIKIDVDVTRKYSDISKTASVSDYGSLRSDESS